MLKQLLCFKKITWDGVFAIIAGPDNFSILDTNNSRLITIGKKNMFEYFVDLKKKITHNFYKI